MSEKIHDAEEAARITRLMAAAYDSPGVTVRDGNLSLRVSRASINPVFVKMLTDRTDKDQPQ